MEISYEEIKKQAAEACEELVETAKLKAGDILAQMDRNAPADWSGSSGRLFGIA